MAVGASVLLSSIQQHVSLGYVFVLESDVSVSDQSFFSFSYCEQVTPINYGLKPNVL